MLEASEASPGLEEPTERTRLVSPLDLPSATTMVFLLIVAMSLSFILPLGGSGSGASIGLVLPLIVLLASLRLFLSFPKRLTERYKTMPLGGVDPELAERAQQLAAGLRIVPEPTFLYTEKPRVPLQAFGTFRRSFVVINKVEIDAARARHALKALETMLLHELAHVKTGDQWKLQLAKQIVFVLLAVTGVVMVLGMTSSFSFERLLLSGPVGRADLIATVLGLTLNLGIMLYALTVMQSVREYYADAWVLRVQGVEQGRPNLMLALISAGLFWSGSASTTTQSVTWRSRLASLAFSRNRAPGAVERLEAVEESTRLGAPFFGTMRQVVLAGGLAVGSQLLAPDTGGTQLLLMGVGLGGTFVGLTYLLPCLAAADRTLAQSTAQAVTAALVFMAGILAYGLLRSALVLVVYALSGVYWPGIQFMLQGDLGRVGPLALCGLGLAVALVSATPLIRWWLEGTGELSSARKTALGLSAFAQSAWVFAALATLASAGAQILRHEMSDTWTALWPLVVLLPPGACLTVGVRWYTLRHSNSKDMGRAEGR